MIGRKSKGVLQRLSGGALTRSENSGSIFKRGIVALAQHLNAEACFQRARAAYKAHNFSEAVLWCRKAAEQGHTLAQRNLGFCYEFGIGVTQDDAQAVLWYRKSVEHGDSEGQNAVNRITRDDAKAVLKYRVQADSSLYRARIRLGYVPRLDEPLHYAGTFYDDDFNTDWQHRRR